MLCTACGNDLPPDNFSPRADRPSGRRSQCRTCRAAKARTERSSGLPEAPRGESRTFPAGPFIDVLGHVERYAPAGHPTISEPPGIRTISELTGSGIGAVRRAIKLGLTDRQADHWANALGLHPFDIWGDLWVQHGLTFEDRVDIAFWRRRARDEGRLDCLEAVQVA